MAFKKHKSSSAKTQVIEYYLATDSEAITLGEALVLTSGRLTKCGATATPEFIALGSRSAGTDVQVPVARVMEDEEYETTFSADASSNAVGTKVTLHTDGLTVTDTATNGVFTITKKLGTGASGTSVRGMFRR